MKILLISDLHIDINQKILKTHDFGFFKQLKDDEINILLIAGDIAGSSYFTTKMVEQIAKYINDCRLKTKVIFTIGNHEPYSYDIESKTIEDINRWLRVNYNSGTVEFLQDTYTVIDDYVIFGSTLYTDFSLCNNQKNDMIDIPRYINDFKYCKTETEDEVYTVKPVDYLHKFIKSRYMIKEVCKKFPDKKIVILTHFAPSGKSIHSQYVASNLNPFYASNLEDIINEYDNIKLWCHGHTHNQFDYKIGNTTILCNPYGYYGYEQVLTPDEYCGKLIEV